MAWLDWHAVTLPWRKGEARVLYWTEAGKESRDHVTALRWFFFLWCCGYLLCAGCAHRYKSHQTATRHEETRTEWKTAASAEQERHETATEKRAGSKLTRRFDRQSGKLVEEVLEQYQSDGRVQVAETARASRSAAGADFSNVRASSSSTKASDTETRLPWFRIGLGVALAAVIVYAFLRWRARRFRLT